MEWYPSLFLTFFRQLIFPCRHMCSLETFGTILTSRLVFVENVIYIYSYRPRHSCPRTSISAARSGSRRQLSSCPRPTFRPSGCKGDRMELRHQAGHVVDLVQGEEASPLPRPPCHTAQAIREAGAVAAVAQVSLARLINVM